MNTMKGMVKFFDPNRGFGFISGEDGTSRFFHCSAWIGDIRFCPSCQAEIELPIAGEEVVFLPEQTEKGPSAVNVSRPYE